MLVPEMDIKHPIGHRNMGTHTGQAALDQRTDAGVFGVQRRIGLGVGAAPLRTPRFPLGGSREWGACRDRHVH